MKIKEKFEGFKDFLFWLKIRFKVKRLGCKLLNEDVLACRDESLLILLGIYKFQGKTKAERQEDCIALIKAHFKIKEEAEQWPIALNYSLGDMRALTKRIRSFQSVVDVIARYNTILDNK